MADHSYQELRYKLLEERNPSEVKVYWNGEVMKEAPYWPNFSIPYNEQGHVLLELTDEEVHNVEIDLLNFKRDIIDVNKESLFAGVRYEFKIRSKMLETSTGPDVSVIDSKEMRLRVGGEYNFTYRPSGKSKNIEIVIREKDHVNDGIKEIYRKEYNVMNLPNPEMKFDTRKNTDFGLELIGKVHETYKYTCEISDRSSSFKHFRRDILYGQGRLKDLDINLIEIGDWLICEINCKCPGDIKERKIIRVVKKDV